MKNFLSVVIVLFITISSMCSCGYTDAETKAKDIPSITFYYSDNSIFTTSTMGQITVGTKEKQSMVATGPIIETTTTTSRAATTTTATTTVPAVITTEATTTTKSIETAKVETTKPIETTTQKVTTTVTTTTTPPATTTTIAAISSGYKLPYILTDDNWFMICKVVCSETGYCSDQQQKAVAWTIFNRIIYSATHSNSPFPNTVYGILHQKNQYNAINYWRSDTSLQPGGKCWNHTMALIKALAYEDDFTNGAIGYYNPYMSGYLSAFENNSALVFCYQDSTGRFFRLR